MNNYEKFIDDLKKEANNKEIADYSAVIKAQYKMNHTSSLKQSKTFFKWGFSLLAVLVLAFVGYLIWEDNKIKPAIEIPGMETMEETYAFEIAAAANMVHNMDLSEMMLSSTNSGYTPIELARKGSETSSLDDVAAELNKYIYTIKQLLDNEIVKTKETVLVTGDYQYQMSLSAKINENQMMEYQIQYNKTNITEHAYHLEGIIEIGGKPYLIKGTQESLEDEQVLMVRIYFNSNNFISIHQVVEEGMTKFVYREFINHHRISELAIGIGEKNGYRIISIDSREGKVRGRFDALYDDSNMIIRSRYEKYRGNISVEIIDRFEVRYYFVREKKEIIIKKSDNLALDYRFLLVRNGESIFT